MGTASDKDIAYLAAIVIIAFIMLALSGCANTPTTYNQHVKIISGEYKGQEGTLIGDCSWFENYKIRLYDNHNICAKIWEIEKFNQFD